MISLYGCACLLRSILFLKSYSANGSWCQCWQYLFCSSICHVSSGLTVLILWLKMPRYVSVDSTYFVARDVTLRQSWQYLFVPQDTTLRQSWQYLFCSSRYHVKNAKRLHVSYDIPCCDKGKGRRIDEICLPVRRVICTNVQIQNLTLSIKFNLSKNSFILSLLYLNSWRYLSRTASGAEPRGRHRPVRAVCGRSWTCHPWSWQHGRNVYRGACTTRSTLRLQNIVFESQHHPRRQPGRRFSGDRTSGWPLVRWIVLGATIVKIVQKVRAYIASCRHFVRWSVNVLNQINFIHNYPF